MFNTVISHASALSGFFGHYKKGTLAPTQLWFGEEGIGKFYAAKAFAIAVLEDSSTLRPAKSFVDQGAHPNLFILRPIEDKKDISAEQARTLLPFLNATPLYEGYRIVIIDTVDQLNRQAANALLKVLEEPPSKTIIILLSHNIGKVLPTILSRAIKTPFYPLSSTEMHTHFPEYSKDIIEMSEGRPGFAQKLSEMDANALTQHMGKGLFLGLQKNYAALQTHLTSLEDTVQKNILTLLPHFLKRLIASPMNAPSEGIKKLLELQHHGRWVEGFAAWEIYYQASLQAYIPVKDILYGSFLLLSNPILSRDIDLHTL